MKYGWYKKKLYRLPSTINLRSYSFKKVPEILIGNKIGYRLMKKKYTIEQLKLLTIPIYETKIIQYNLKDIPFYLDN
jgi:hypothetical protein